MKKSVINFISYLEKCTEKLQSYIFDSSLDSNAKIFYNVLVAWDSAKRLEKVVKTGKKISSPFLGNLQHQRTFR